MGLAIAALRWVLLSWSPDPSPRQVPLVEVLIDLFNRLRESTGWAYPAAAALAGVGITLWAFGIRRHRHDADAERISAAAATVLRVPTASIRLRKVGWSRGQMTHGRLHYPRGGVISDLSEDLATALGPFAAAPLQAEWHRRADRFILRPRPARPARIEETQPAIKQVFLPLEQLITGVTVDQRQTWVDKQGDVEQMVVTYPMTTRDIGDAFPQRVQAVLDAKSPSPTGYWSLNWDPAANSVTIHPSVPLPTSAPYPLTPPAHRMRVPIGMGEGGAVAEWDPVHNPHLLIVGPTGTGKTIFLNNLITGALARSWTVSIGDPKKLSYRGFDPTVLAARGLPIWPGITMVGTSDRDIERVIDDAYQLMDRRYEQIRTFGVLEKDLQPHLLVLDEISELVARLNAYQVADEKLHDLQTEAVAEGRDPAEVNKPKGTKNPEVLKIWSLLRLGRQCLVFVLLATQRPDVSYIPGDARDNVLAKGGLGKLSGHALEMVFGTRAVQQRVHEIGVDPQTGRRTRVRIPGRATLDLGSGPMTVQPFWTPDPAKAITGELSSTDHALVADLHAFVTTHHRAPYGASPAVSEGSGSWSTPITPLTRPLPVPVEDDVGTGVIAVEELSTTVFDEVDPQDYQQLRADQLTGDRVVLLEVDGRATLVRIVDIEPDPFGEDDELQVTYEIAGPDERAGQPGVTTLSAREPVLAEP